MSLAAVAIAAAASTSTWNLDASHSQASFTVKHMMVANVRGEFRKLEGVLTLDDKDLTKSNVDVTIDAASIDTRDEKRDAHLKSPDFFDVANTPKITFKSTKIEKSGDGYKVAGNLTLHGVTKPVVLDVEGPTAPVKSPWGTESIGISGTTQINRKDFGLVWNKPLEVAGGVLVSDTVKISIDAEFVKAPPAK